MKLRKKGKPLRSEEKLRCKTLLKETLMCLNFLMVQVIYNCKYNVLKANGGQLASALNFSNFSSLALLQ